ncbi:LysR family transcriptional regulator [Gemmatimonas groenlandica]|uniref:LysR family transcriptional regulator n=1 Tax=Gemmatimonas groenlandica TaxID=2732249 RepID=A0A6M4IUH1_9BACT|nr:LysR family transcriptional regulator [Gemmatimonas groenlandica]QJR37146.1 LysR family transcriptional regulator [Gemmatimonas groenlandica]
MTNVAARLNYHHLHYFWAVAREGNLTRAAQRLHVSQSALSTQIRQLESQLGQQLFERRGRTLELTEAGRIALDYADSIVTAGNELVGTLRDGRRDERHVLRVGSVATLSRNFQRAFLAPILKDPSLSLVLQSGSLAELLSRLRAHTLDVVLSNRRVPEDADHAWRSSRIARQQVSLVGPPRSSPFRYPDELADVPLLLPSRDHEFRTAFDVLCDERGLRPTVIAEADDMAMLRVLTRELNAVALVPAVVVQDELRDGRLQEYCAVPDLFEEFHAISVTRRYQPSLLRTLLARRTADVLNTIE